MLVAIGRPNLINCLPTALSATLHRPSALHLTPGRIAYSAVQPSIAYPNRRQCATQHRITSPPLSEHALSLTATLRAQVARNIEMKVVVRQGGSVGRIGTKLRAGTYSVFGALGPAYTARRKLLLLDELLANAHPRRGKLVSGAHVSTFEQPVQRQHSPTMQHYPLGENTVQRRAFVLCKHAAWRLVRPMFGPSKSGMQPHHSDLCMHALAYRDATRGETQIILSPRGVCCAMYSDSPRCMYDSL